jgi:hypothetical protein
MKPFDPYLYAALNGSGRGAQKRRRATGGVYRVLSIGAAPEKQSGSQSQQVRMLDHGFILTSFR